MVWLINWSGRSCFLEEANYKETKFESKGIESEVGDQGMDYFIEYLQKLYLGPSESPKTPGAGVPLKTIKQKEKVQKYQKCIKLKTDILISHYTS